MRGVFIFAGEETVENNPGGFTIIWVSVDLIKGYKIFHEMSKIVIYSPTSCGEIDQKPQEIDKKLT